MIVYLYSSIYIKFKYFLIICKLLKNIFNFIYSAHLVAAIATIAAALAALAALSALSVLATLAAYKVAYNLIGTTRYGASYTVHSTKTCAYKTLGGICCCAKNIIHSTNDTADRAINLRKESIRTTIATSRTTGHCFYYGVEKTTQRIK